MAGACHCPGSRAWRGIGRRGGLRWRSRLALVLRPPPFLHPHPHSDPDPDPNLGFIPRPGHRPKIAGWSLGVDLVLVLVLVLVLALVLPLARSRLRRRFARGRGGPAQGSTAHRTSSASCRLRDAKTAASCCRQRRSICCGQWRALPNNLRSVMPSIVQKTALRRTFLGGIFLQCPAKLRPVYRKRGEA
jgi:hypothetical protein